MRTEIIEILQKSYPEYCLKHIDTANEILRLIEKDTKLNYVYRCEICDKTFGDKLSLKEHREISHPF
jgi:hypothetical protein